MKIIIYLLILSICVACSNSKKSQSINGTRVNKKVELVYDTSGVMMEVVFYPENFDDIFNYTYSSSYNKSKIIDTSKHTYYDYPSYAKNLIFFSKDNLVIHELYANKALISKGEYYLESKIHFNKEDLYDELANKTDSARVTLYQKAFRNGEWEYYNDGVKVKVETWSMGIMDTVVYFEK